MLHQFDIFHPMRLALTEMTLRKSLISRQTQTCSSMWIIGHASLEKIYKSKPNKTGRSRHLSPKDPSHPFCFLVKQCCTSNFSTENWKEPYNGKNRQYFFPINSKWFAVIKKDSVKIKPTDKLNKLQTYTAVIRANYYCFTKAIYFFVLFY